MKTPPSYRMKSRMIVVLVSMIVFGFCLVVHSLFRIQIVEGQDMQNRALGQQMREERVGATRGVIYDTTGKVLARSSSVWQICVSPADIENLAGGDDEVRARKRQEVIDCLYNVLGIDKKKVEKALQDTGSYYVVVQKKVERPEYEKLIAEINAKKIKGIFAEEMTQRRYPYGNLASTVLGFANNDNVGATGLESYYEKTLSGTPGRVVSLRNRAGATMPLEYEQTYEAKNGNSLVLTIDEQLQHYLEKNLEIAVSEHRVRNRVTGIIMDVNTGAVLAMASKPDFDPNDPYTISDPDMTANLEEIKKETDMRKALAATAEEQKKAEDEYQNAVWKAHNTLWRNKAISDPYEPGSVFKIVTLSTALEVGSSTLNSHYNCIGYKEVAGRQIHCHYWGSHRMGHGDQTLAQATMNSCNPAYIEIGQGIGATRFAEYFGNFGLMQGTGIDLPGEANSIYHTKFSAADLASSAFGQTNKLTPIQLITACSAAVNGGKLMQPYVVRQVLDSDGNVVSNTEPYVKREVISEQTSKTVREILEQVVSEGSGQQARIPGYKVGGKTGTSEKLDERDPETGRIPNVLSFFGFAPADDPQIACLVMLDDPDIYDAWGSVIAAPIVGSILSDSLPYLGIEPQYTEEELEKQTNQVPYLVNYDIHEAESKLRIAGMRYRIMGGGSKVLQQIPGAGEILPEEGSVVLYTEEVQEDNIVEVPNVVGKSATEVNTQLAGLGFNVAMAGDTLEGASLVAVSQTPEAGTKVASGSVVTVTFAEQAPPAEPASAPANTAGSDDSTEE